MRYGPEGRRLASILMAGGGGLIGLAGLAFGGGMTLAMNGSSLAALLFVMAWTQLSGGVIAVIAGGVLAVRSRTRADAARGAAV